MDYFDTWWAGYFRKEARVKAEMAAKKMKIKPEEWALIIADTKRRIRFFEYHKTAKIHRPMGSSYLNGRRWEDEYDDPPVENNKNSEADEFISLAKNKWNKSFPSGEVSPIIKDAFYRAKRYWRDWQVLVHEDPEKARKEILRYLDNIPYTDRMMDSAGDK